MARTKGGSPTTTSGEGVAAFDTAVSISNPVHDRAIAIAQVQGLFSEFSQYHHEHGIARLLESRKFTVRIREMGDAEEAARFKAIHGVGKITLVDMVSLVSEYNHIRNDQVAETLDGLGRNQMYKDTGDDVLGAIAKRTRNIYEDEQGNGVGEFVISLPLVEAASKKLGLTKSQGLHVVTYLRAFEYNKRCMAEKPMTSRQGRYFALKLWQSLSHDAGLVAITKDSRDSDNRGSQFDMLETMNAFMDERPNLIDDAIVFSLTRTFDLEKVKGGGGEDRQPSQIKLTCANGSCPLMMVSKITVELFSMYGLGVMDKVQHCGADMDGEPIGKESEWDINYWMAKFKLDE